MNLELLDPFRNSFPEIIEETLEEGICTTCAFNRRGTLLCTGCADGRCIIWDFDTKGIAQILTGILIVLLHSYI
jgi:COMPASS component SWD1